MANEVEKQQVARSIRIPYHEGLTQVRCPHCGRLFFEANLAAGSFIEMMCPKARCRQLVRIFKL
ncbi:MAG: hypothetical protein ABFD89_06990 [Bryobacteraceae bacterium]